MIFSNSFSKRFIKGTSAGLSLASTFVCTQETAAAPGGCKDFCLNFLRCICPCWDCLFGNQISGVWYVDQKSEDSSSVIVHNDSIWKNTRLSVVDSERLKNKESEIVGASQEKCSGFSVIFDLSDLFSETEVCNLGDVEKKLFLKKCGNFLKKYKEKICVKKGYKNQSGYKDLDVDYLINLCDSSSFYSDCDGFFACLKKFEAVLKIEEVKDLIEDVANVSKLFKKVGCSENIYSVDSSSSSIA